MIEKNNTTLDNNTERGIIQIEDLINLVLNHKIWYILSVLLCLLLAVFYIYRTPKTFSRSAKLIVDESAESSTMRDLTSFANNIARYRTNGSNVFNEVEAFNTPDLLAMVVKRLGYETTYTEKQFLRTRELFSNTPFVLVPSGDNPVVAYSFTVSREKDNKLILKNFLASGKKIETQKILTHFGETVVTPVGKIKLIETNKYPDWKNEIVVTWMSPMLRAKSYLSRYNVSVVGKQSSVISLTLTDNYPMRAENILATIINIYNEIWVDNKNKAAVTTSKFIEERLKTLEKDLGSVEDSLKNFKESKKIPDIQAVSSLYLKQSSEYGSKTFEMRSQLSIAKDVKEHINDPRYADDFIPANTGLNSPSLEQQIKSYNETLLKRKNLIKESTIDNPAIADLDDALEQMKMSVDRSIDNLISMLELQVKKLESKEDAILNSIASTSGYEFQLLSIERQQKVKEQLYLYLLQKREENEITAQVNVSNTRLIMEPNGSVFAIAPRKSMILLIALILGFGIPFVIFYLIWQFDTRVKSRSDLESLSTPFLAEIPHFGEKASWWNRFRRKPVNNHNCRIIVEPGNRNYMNEAFRVLRTNLDLMIGKEKGTRIMVTSLNPNAGKTFMIMNMATSMSLKGAKTLLLDLDLRKATLSKALDLNNTGVSSYLNGNFSDYKELVYKVKDNLFILPVGTLPPNPAELLLSDRFKDLMEKVSKDYDYIFIDCPPVDVVADTGIIAGEADITLFIMRANMFDKRALPVIQNMSDEGKYKRLTLILNGVSLERRGYGYSSYGYGYGYGYGSENDSEIN